MHMLGVILFCVAAQGQQHWHVCDDRSTCTGADFNATTLHLKDGEHARHGPSHGGGLIEEALTVDVLVAGGGSAGTSAAIAAARNGATVVLVEGAEVLGGNSGSTKRVTMVGACGPRSSPKNQFSMDCREGGIVEEYQLNSAAHNPDFVSSLFSLEILTLVKAEPNITLLLNTWLTGVTTAGEASAKTITSATCEDQASQRRYVITAKTYVDATGDGRLGAEAGAEYIQGREGRSEWNESLAMPIADNETEGTSIIYQAEDKGQRRGWSSPFWAARYNKSEFRYRSVGGRTKNGFWWNEVSYPYNTITDGNVVTQTGISQILGIWDYIKNSGDHTDSATMGLTWVGQVGGKREGRRFRGQYVVNQNDVYPNATAGRHWAPTKAHPTPPEPKLFHDRVSYSGWSFDLHNPKGMLDPDHPPFVPTMTPYMFSTPLRALVSKDLDNLFFAGRLASFSHVVYGSQRVMRSCAAAGQAAGSAAAYATAHGVTPASLAADPAAVWSIQQQLIRDDAFIIGVANEDPRDFARTATASATSERKPNAATNDTIDGSASNVLSGQNRATNGKLGVAPSNQGKPGSNRWISDPGQPLPAALTLTLADSHPQMLAQIQLTFDTGMHQKLNFNSVGSKKNAPGGWGPQAETVRDYIIEGRATAGTGPWLPLCNVSGNYQRRRVHTLPCAPGPAPGPPTPGPAPGPSPAIASGALSADLCSASAGQLWSRDALTGEVSTIDEAGEKLCLGYDDKNISAFGGAGLAVVARPCGKAHHAISWTLRDGNGTAGAVLLETTNPTPCLASGGASAVCDATRASSFTFAGAGSADVNGKYVKTTKRSDGNIPVFQKDDTHQLYRFGGVWKLAQMGETVYYQATDNVPDKLPGPPATGWVVYCPSKKLPAPTSVTCASTGPVGPPGPVAKPCSCVHAVACAACHPTAAGGQTYYAGTTVEMAGCSAKVTHLEWLQLAVRGASTEPKGAAMLMSGGLCLSAAEPPSMRAAREKRDEESRVRTAGDRAALVAANPPPRVEAPAVSAVAKAGIELGEVRVTVTAMNGHASAIVNEIRLYDRDGVAPFPVQPQQQ